MKLLLLFVVVLSLAISSVIADAQAEERYDYYNSYSDDRDWCPRHKECCTVFVPPVTKTTCNRFTRPTVITFSTSSGAAQSLTSAICTTGCGLTVCDGSTTISNYATTTSSIIAAGFGGSVVLSVTNPAISLGSSVVVIGTATGTGAATLVGPATGAGFVSATVSVPVALTNTITVSAGGAAIATTTIVGVSIVPVVASVSVSVPGVVTLRATASISASDSISTSTNALSAGTATVNIPMGYEASFTTTAIASAVGPATQYIFCDGVSSLSCVTCIATSTGPNPITSTCVGVSVPTPSAPIFPF